MPDISRKMPENNGKITGDYEELPGNNGQSSGTCGEMPGSPGETPVTDCRTNPAAEQSARPKSALIAMSGGVDSSVAAYIMKRDGYYCEGTTMRLYRNEDIGLGSFRTCCSQKDIEDAGEVAFRLDIPYEVLDLTVDFKKHIIDKFIRVYEAGGTPNPCIDCNRYMKFDMLLKVAEERGLSYVVTGHYARIQYDCERGLYLLRKAADPGKDQSYVLYMLGQEQLARIKFPLGDIPKDETRRIAAEQGFVNAEKHDSQDICFVPDGDYVGFMEQYTGKTYPAGDFTDRDGNIVGHHRGAVHYTIGQRKGIGISFNEPVYVTAKDMAKNTVSLGPENELYKRGLVAEDVNWILPPDKSAIEVTARTRYRQVEKKGTAYPLPGNRLKLIFDEPQRAITVGQAVVLYDGDVVLGGGTISGTVDGI